MNYLEGNSDLENARLNDEKQKLDDYAVQNNLDEVEIQIELNNGNIDRLNAQLHDIEFTCSEKPQIKHQMVHQTIYGYELEARRELYIMQVSGNELYSEYSKLITDMWEKQVKKTAYELLLDIAVNKNKITYLESLEEQKEHELNVIRESLKIGYATESNVISAEAALEKVRTQKSVCENESDYLISSYNNSSKKKYEDCYIEYAEKELSALDDYMQSFRDNSFYGEYYRKQADIYSGYAESLGEILLKMDKDKRGNPLNAYKISEDEQKYYDRVYRYIENEQKYYENEAAIAENNAVRYEKSLELYVTETYLNAKSFMAQHRAKSAEIILAEKQLEISRSLLELGRITQTDHMEAQNEVLRLKTEIKEIETKILKYYYILDNGVESY
ncbi:MAG: TolC family protein [Oscillospiraceae bacterium]|nr:TolC family protein [Oscillospiraceae bacterium]